MGIESLFYFLKIDFSDKLTAAQTVRRIYFKKYLHFIGFFGKIKSERRYQKSAEIFVFFEGSLIQIK